MKNQKGLTRLAHRAMPEGRSTTGGFVPIIGILIVVLLGAGTYAVVSRDVLKSYFEKGDKPTESNRTELKDKFEDGDIPTGENAAKGDKPKESQFNNVIDSSINISEKTKKQESSNVEQKNSLLVEKNVSKCTSNPSPTFTSHITDMSKVDYVVPPPTIESGINLKPHGYIGTNGANVPLYAPVAMTLKDGAYYTNGPYLLDFQVSCEVTVRFGHMTNPVDSIKKLFPNEPESDSRTHELSPVSFAAGEIIGYTTGTSGTNAAGNWDFGVFNSSVSNRYANDPAWNNHLTNTTAVCPFDYFTSNLKVAYTSKFDGKSMAGNPPHGESFCQ